MAQPDRAKLGALQPAAQPAPAGIFAALRAPGYPRLWTSGWLWNLTRWMAVFLASYLINQRTGSPLLVQLGGAAFYTPILLGGALGGVISDRFDRRIALMTQLAILIPVTGLMGVLTLADRLPIWLLFPFMFVVGAGWVVDMTSRRALVFDMVGAERITNAMALEAMSQTGGAMLGNLLGGAVINFVGIGQTFLAMAAVYAIAWLCLVGLPPVPRGHVPTSGSSVRADLVAGFRYVRGQRILLGVLGVTVLVNCFYYPYQPLVPVVADRMQVNAFWAGLLAASAGVGSLGAVSLIAANRRQRRGWTYLGGAALALAGVLVFAASSRYAVALVGLIIAGAGQACFNTMQGTITLASATPAMRGRALGVISMGIGVLPVSLPLVGLAAQVAGPQAALLGTTLLGLILLALWTIRSTDLRAVT
ncbi:MAG: MFS transporter [Dehalococcoidia bacterium]